MAVQVPSRLYRSRSQKMIAGVSGGLGEYFDVDPVLIRLLFVVTAFISGVGLLAYIVLWIVVPLEGDESPRMDALRQDFDDISGRVREYVDRRPGQPGGASGSTAAGPAAPAGAGAAAPAPAGAAPEATRAASYPATTEGENDMTSDSTSARVPVGDEPRGTDDLTIDAGPGASPGTTTSPGTVPGAGPADAPFGTSDTPFGTSDTPGGSLGAAGRDPYGPDPYGRDPFGSSAAGPSAFGPGATGPELYGPAVPLAPPDRRRRRQHWAGAILIVLGLLILGNNLGLLWWIEAEFVLPLLLVGAGAWLLFGRGRRV